MRKTQSAEKLNRTVLIEEINNTKFNMSTKIKTQKLSVAEPKNESKQNKNANQQASTIRLSFFFVNLMELHKDFQHNFEICIYWIVTTSVMFLEKLSSLKTKILKKTLKKL